MNTTIPTWHLERAKAVLDAWYDRAEMWRDIAKEHPWAADDCKANALVSKTLGIVWYDRYKLLLGTQRPSLEQS